jgi:integrase
MKATTGLSVAEALAIRSVPVLLSSGDRTWTVVGHDHLPVDDVEAYLQTRRAFGAPSNTVRSYSSHLVLFLRWCSMNEVAVQSLTFPQLCHFVEALTLGEIPTRGASDGRPRRPAAVKPVLSALESYLEFLRLEGRGPSDLRIYKEQSHRGRSGPGAFLEHVERSRWRERRLPMPKVPRRVPEVLQEPFENLLAACYSYRDRLLLTVMHDAGLRIGQALGLRHGDLDPGRHKITIVRRPDNVNGAVSKQPDTFSVKVRPLVFDLYREYLIEELVPAGIESDYLFVNLHKGRIGRPMTDSNARQIVHAIGRRAGIDLHPHVLRHSHGTLLARAGWSNAQIAKRLGHSHASSSDAYIHLVESDVDAKYDETAVRLWGEA